MEANKAKLLDFLKKSPQFAIPIYQRTYSWTEKECRQLWDDILRTGTNGNISAHFIGSIVYIKTDIYQITTHSPLLVIDGQQRLTTLTLLITALAKALDQFDEEKREPLDGFSPRKLRNYYLFNPEEDGERHYKLILSQTDKESLISVIDNREKPREYSLRIMDNFKLFESWVAGCKDNLIPLCKGLAKLIVVDIALNRDQDNPQLIFESMNSTGKELSQADLIRNFILMGLEPQLQTRLYEQFWRPMELDFGQEAYSEQFDGFMRHYLTVKTGEIPRIGEVYEAFKIHARSNKTSETGIEALVSDIRTFSRYYCAIALGTETDLDLKLAFNDLRELRVDVAFPFLLELYHDYVTRVLSREDFVAAIRLVEAYVFRRAICSIPTNSMNKTFATFSRSIKKDRYLESIQAHLFQLPSYRRFPNNDEFRQEIQTRDVYNFRSRSYLLRRLENYGRKERVHVDEYTIEHIMPQNENLPAEWKTELGSDWKRVHNTWLHTLGNLTLTGYNSQYSDRPFKEKCNMSGGFKESPLKLNKGISQLEQWNEEAIKERASKLADIALEVWEAPKLSDDILALYKYKAVISGYTIKDHPYLNTGAMHNLFEAFRKEILALDSCVTEEFLKLYVAYKAETNFVDVIPQSKRLILTLNMTFSEINDPKGKCLDITGLGHWGNGNIEVSFDSLTELPYIIGLVWQSLERQIGNGANL